ncbi:MAG: peptidoglycan-binding protein [Micromonosporaceae bacterium]|nr:peptidoglycan-binding protein [Micromonosporaceae bacterium]
MAAASRTVGMVGLAVVLLGAGGWVAVHNGVFGGPAAATGDPQVPTGTATVTRTDVVAQQQMPGTLGFDGSYTVVAPGGAGVLTRLPAPGTVVSRGQPLYEVDGRPVPLWYGDRPAWRPFASGMTDGPDVRELEANLVALGYDTGDPITVDNHFTAATAAAIRRWQHAQGVAQTGRVAVGELVLLPGPIRVVTQTATVGSPVHPGAPVLSGTSTRPAVTVALPTVLQQLVHRGDKVLVTLPDGRSLDGTVTAVSRVAATGGQDGSGSNGSGPNGSGGAQPSISVQVALADPHAAAGLDQAPVQVAITTQQHRGVLAVPVTALLANGEGGYSVELAGGRRVTVQIGLFDEQAGLVEVSGGGIAEGETVEVPAS